MADPATPVAVETPEPSFADWMQAENARERADAPVEPATSAPEPSQTVGELDSQASVTAGRGTGEPSVEPETVLVEASPETPVEAPKDSDLYVRKADGTFKKRSLQDRINLAVGRQRAAEARAAAF